MTRQRGVFKTVLGAIRSALTENLGLKLICFVFAFLLVAYQRSLEDQKTRTVVVQLDRQLPPESVARELMTTLPPNIKLTVEGSTRALDQMVSQVSSLELDLRQGKTEEIRLQPEDFDVPPGVKIKFIEPSKIELEWQDVIVRRVPVQSAVTGNVARGYEVAEITVEPSEIQLRGPANLVNVTQFVRVAPFDVTGLSEGSFRRLLALDPAPERTSYIGVSSVAVTVEVRRRLISQLFRAVPVHVIGIPGTRTIPPSVDVTVIGPPEVVRGLSRELIVPRVDVTNVDTQNHGSVSQEVTVDLSRAKAEIQPPTVTIHW